MRTTTYLPFVALLTFTGLATTATAGPGKEVTLNTENLAKLDPVQQERAVYIADRLNTIAAMDVQDLDRTERKELRAEVKALGREAKDLNRGGTVIYLSTAGIIIIVLLLIILL
jgi:hypothetical protein